MKGSIILLLCATLASAAVFEGTVNDDSGYHFIGKFVFDTSPDEGGPGGNLTISLEVPGWTDSAENKTKYAAYEIWLFDDEDNSWPAIYGKDIACTEARKLAKNFNKDTQSITGNFKVQFDVEGKAVAKADINQHSRDRYWFAIVAHCQSDGTHKVENVKYHSHFENLNRGWWDKEFGANQAGLQTLYLCFFLVYLPFTITHFFGVVQLSKKLEYVHPMVKIFALVILLQMVVILANLSYWCAYISNGMGLPSALIVGELTNVVSRTMFILILMLMAKGWTISGDELSGKKFVILVVAAFLVADALITVWRFLVEDPAAVVPDLGVTIFLYVILLVWLILASWFAYTVCRSYKNEDNPVKKTLYRNMAIVYFPWFFGLPLVTLLTLQLNAWVAQRIVETVSLLVSTAGYMVLSFLLWPSRAEEYFNISTPDVMKAQIDTYEQL